MEIRPTGFEGLLEIVPKSFYDERGHFLELYKENAYAENGLNITFVQDNLSYSKKGVVRGLHLQFAPYAQLKLVSVVQGKVLDVVVDVRPDSKTFKKVFSIILDSTVRNMLLIPEGFAHGFSAIEDSTFLYKCSSPYNAKHEGGILVNDSQLNIDWQVTNPIISFKDLQLPTFEDFLIKSVLSQNS